VARYVPLVTPSLQSLSLLQQRGAVDHDLRHGCVLAVSDFDQRHAPLPEVWQEARSLASHMNGRGTVLYDKQATWKALRALGGQAGLAEHAFLHVASHAFYDAVSGRASGLALHDRDVWLDELWELAPLPSLFSLSACSGMQSYLYEGDEPIGLATTCLQAGAQHVVGSLWPMPDADAASVMSDFYHYFFDGSAPPQALAAAQRQAALGDLAWRCWAPFICVGALERT
jgi:CHAT domain-containing protein